MHAAQNPLELSPAAISELLGKLISVLPTWVIVVVVLVFVAASVVRHLSRTLVEHRAMTKASNTKDGALEVVRITQAARRRRLPQLRARRDEERPSSPAPASE